MGRHDENGSENQEGAVSFETYRDEALHFQHVQQFHRAIESFTKALELKPDDQNCLVTRSKCYLQVGNAEASLVDAEMALKENDKLIKGFFQKAEALYQKGDFETALMFYHRGHRLRPELQEFRLGIQKSQEAINNSIGTPDSVKLEANKGDMTYFYKQEEELEKLQQKEKKEREKDKKSDQQEVPARTKNAKKQQKGSYQKPTAKKQERKEREAPKGTADAKTVKQLLGELYGDKEYLEKLLKDQSLIGKSKPDDMSREIKDKVVDGLEYLHGRTEFWRQQKPMYARKRDQARKREEWKKSKRGGKGSMDAVLRNLEEIDEAQTEGRYLESLEMAKKTLKIVEADNNDGIQNRDELRASLNSSIGNAYLELGKLNQALEYHSRDLDIARDCGFEDAKSRALDNLGRVYARRGDFDKAIEVWKEKIPASKSPLESTWLYHEIGRCYLEMGKNSDARDYGEKSLMAAREADDCGWQLHASVLVAQSEVKLGDYQAAADSFEKSLELAKRQNDDAAEQAITKALDEVNEKIVKGVKDGEGDDEANDKYDDDFETDKEQVTKSKTPSPSPPPPPPPKEPSPEPEREPTPPRKKSVSIREDVEEDDAADNAKSEDGQDSKQNSPEPQTEVEQQEQQQQQQRRDSTDDDQQQQQPVSESEQTGVDTGESTRDKSPEPQQQQQQQQQQEEQRSEKGSTGSRDAQQREA